MLEKNSLRAHSWWMGILILGAVAAAMYFAWPPVAVYFGKTSMGTIVRKHARQCFRDGKEACVQAIVDEARSEGITIDPLDIDVSHVTRKGVHYDLTYKAELKYPFTGTMFGSGKRRFKRVHMIVKTEMSGL